MAQTATIYQMRVDVTDMHRSVYESLSLRVARHASEDEERMVTRVLAYALLYEEGMEFGRGVSDVDEPALWVRSPTGEVLHWIDVGQPSAERLHRASKLAGKVSLVCHKGTTGLVRDMKRQKVHKADELDVILLSETLVDDLVAALSRSSDWTVIRNENDLQITVGDASVSGTLTESRLSELRDG